MFVKMTKDQIKQKMEYIKAYAGALNAALITQNTYRRAIDTWKKINLNTGEIEGVFENNQYVQLIKTA